MLSALGRALRCAPHGLLNLTDELPLASGRTSSSVLHVCRYTGEAQAPGLTTNGTEAHEDRGLLTVVVSSAAEGLEVLDRGRGQWRRVALGPGQAAILPGLSLEWATAGAVKATMHRVVSRGSGWVDGWVVLGGLIKGQPTRECIGTILQSQDADQHPPLPSRPPPRCRWRPQAAPPCATSCACALMRWSARQSSWARTLTACRRSECWLGVGGGEVACGGWV